MGRLRERLRAREGPLLFGVLNRTPDSFSDGGRFLDEKKAVEHAAWMIESGAAIIDVGAESTRPGAERVDASEQIERLGALVRKLAREDDVLVSVDTTSPDVARWALDQGAAAINSVELEPAADLARAFRGHDAMLILSHARGPMTTMPGFSNVAHNTYDNVVQEVARELADARGRAVDAGLAESAISLDPGLGFHKTAQHSLTLCARLDAIVALGSPVLVGPSRKSFLAAVTKPRTGELAGPLERLGATIAACLLCARNGAAMLRVHDVAEVAQALAFERAARDA